MSTLAVPAALRERPQWVIWRSEHRDRKATKVPYRPRDPARQASTTDPSTWTTFDEAIEASADAAGIGFVFSGDDPYTGIDLDDCLDEHGELAPWAAEIVERLDSYTERSPSGRGLHIMMKARLSGSRHRTGNVEIYDRRRYFTVTGELVGTRDTLQERQEQLDELVEGLFEPPRVPLRPSGGGLLGDDRELLERAFAARNGSKVQALYRGEVNGYGSPSEADLALCGLLAFWTGSDPARLDRMFRGSGLMREKWDRKLGTSTYGERTISQALLGRQEFHAPPETPPAAAERPTDAVHDGEAAEELADLLGLPSVGLTIVGARIVGRGSRASADLYLSDGTEVNFETLREFGTLRTLVWEVATATGAKPSVKGQQVIDALVLLRRVAEHHDTFTRDQVARDWGATYLQSATVIDLDMNDRTARWRAFSKLERHDPLAESREHSVSLAHASRVLRHVNGTRYVRCGWFHNFARTQDASAGGNDQIAQRMLRVGWQRRGQRGRIKATREGFHGQLAWSFFEVPDGWEDGE